MRTFHALTYVWHDPLLEFYIAITPPFQLAVLGTFHNEFLDQERNFGMFIIELYRLFLWHVSELVSTSQKNILKQFTKYSWIENGSFKNTVKKKKERTVDFTEKKAFRTLVKIYFIEIICKLFILQTKSIKIKDIS